MPILKNAKKALRVAKRRTDINSRVRSVMKTMIDKVRKSPSMEVLGDAYSAVDTAVKKKLIHKNKAARLKAQLNKFVKLATGTVGEVVKAAATKVAPKKAATKTVKKTAAPAAKKAAKKPAKKAAKKAE